MSKRKKLHDDREDLVSELQDLHGDAYTPGQLQVWANMLLLRTYDSKDSPPPVPIFSRSQHCTPTKRRSTSERQDEMICKVATAVAAGIAGKSTDSANAGSRSLTSMASGEDVVGASRASSASRGSPSTIRVKRRTECFRQLKEFKALRDQEAITDEQFERMRESVLEDL